MEALPNTSFRALSERREQDGRGIQAERRLNPGFRTFDVVD